MTTPAVFIIGATGRIGSALIRELMPDQAAGRLRLVAATRNADAPKKLEQSGVEARAFHLDGPELHGLGSMTAAFEGISSVFLLTGYEVKMLAQSKAVIDAARQAGVQHVIHLGAHAAPDTTVVHLGWHQLIEAYLAQSGLGFVNLHPTSLMQNLSMLFAIGGAEPGVLTHYIGDAKTSWVDAGDVAAVAAAVLRAPAAHNGRSYGLGTENATMAEIAATLSEVTGRPWKDEPREPDLFFRTVTAAGADPVYMACVRNIFERVSNGSLPDLEATFDTVARPTGHPPTSLRSFLRENQNAFLAPNAHAIM